MPPLLQRRPTWASSGSEQLPRGSMADLEFGQPAFKLLSKNDSGANSSQLAIGVIPKTLRSLFPNLPDPTAGVPAPIVCIEAVLVSDVSPPVAGILFLLVMAQGHSVSKTIDLPPLSCGLLMYMCWPSL